MIDEEGTPGGYGQGYAGGGDWIGAIIGAGAGLYDSHQNRKTSERNTDKTIAAQKAEAELAYQRSMSSWHMQNEYNSPEEQMKRFMAAGLNPHLIYGQGSPGQASAPPQYQPANLQYKYEAPQYGSAIQSILPTLMAVGTWMQDMRMKEQGMKKMDVDMNAREMDMMKAQQLIGFLQQRNPRELQKMDNALDLFPYQKSFQRDTAEKAFRVVADLEREYQFKWGDKLFDSSGQFGSSSFEGMGDGYKKLQFLQQAGKNTSLGYQNKILDAKSSMTDFNITDPQAIMQLVLSGVMGLAGQSIRLANRPKSKVTHETESRMRGGRTTIRRRHYEK